MQKILVAAFVSALLAVSASAQPYDYKYEFQLRRSRSINLNEWRTVVSQVKGARFTTKDDVIVNPKTKERIVIRAGIGDVEVLIDPEGEVWAKHFRFWRDRVICTVGVDKSGNPEPHVKAFLVRFANLLNARIVGEEGEEYRW